jgi:hypothetical protein
MVFACLLLEFPAELGDFFHVDAAKFEADGRRTALKSFLKSFNNFLFVTFYHGLLQA